MIMFCDLNIMNMRVKPGHAAVDEVGAVKRPEGAGQVVQVNILQAWCLLSKETADLTRVIACNHS